MNTITSRLPNSAMSGYDKVFEAGIGNFLFSIKCFLKDYTFDGGKNAGGVINHYCKAYNLNQRIILMTVQKEFGALEMAVAPAQSILDKICGCGVLETGAPLAKYIGFENQIAGACATYRFHYNAFHDGIQAVLTDGKGNTADTLICGSAITYALAKYTPSIQYGINLADKVYTDHFAI